MINIIKKLAFPKVLLRHIMLTYCDFSDIKNIILNIPAMSIFDAYGKDYLYHISKGLMYNCKNGCLPAVQYLIQFGRDVVPANATGYVDDRYTSTGKNGIDGTTFPQQPTQQYIPRSDNKKGSNVISIKFRSDTENCYNYALEYACENGHLHIVQYLVEIGRDIIFRKLNISFVDYITQVRRSTYNVHNVLNDSYKYNCQYGDQCTILNCSLNHANKVHDNNALNIAASHNHLVVVKYLVSMGSNVYNSRPIINAAEKGYYDVAQYLIQEFNIVKKLNSDNIDINYNYDYAITNSAGGGHFNVVQLLVESGVNVQYNHNIALVNACHGNHFEIVKYLVSNGANVTDCNNAPLRHALSNGNLDMVHYLISVGADKNILFNTNIKSVIYLIAKHGYLSTLKYLIELGVKPQLYHNHAVTIAAGYGHLVMVQYLVSVGANIRAKNNIAIKWAAEYNHLDMVQYLISVGADIHATDDYAVRIACKKGHLQIVQYLISVGANILASNNHAIILASKNGHLQIVQYLIEHGADTLANNNRAIKLACKNGHLQVVQCLIESKQLANDKHILKLASKNGHLQIVQYLVESVCINIHADDDVAFIAACYNGQYLIVQYLVEHGANIHAMNGIAIATAMIFGYLNVVQYLISVGGDIYALDNLAIKVAFFNNNQNILTLTDIKPEPMSKTEYVIFKNMLEKLVNDTSYNYLFGIDNVNDRWIWCQ